VLPDTLRDLRRASARSTARGSMIGGPVRIGPWVLDADEEGRLIARHDDAAEGEVAVLAEPPVQEPPGEEPPPGGGGEGGSGGEG
jgi:hypothetical protein